MPSQRESNVRGLSSTRRVLIVDDQHDMAELIAMLLAEHGHEPKIAYNGESALALAAEFRPQVALLDICLPGMDGLELATRMRATRKLCDCRLIALSGHCTEYDLARSKSAGFEIHLAKPVSIEDLLRAISACDSDERAVRI